MSSGVQSHDVTAPGFKAFDQFAAIELGAGSRIVRPQLYSGRRQRLRGGCRLTHCNRNISLGWTGRFLATSAACGRPMRLLLPLAGRNLGFVAGHEIIMQPYRLCLPRRRAQEYRARHEGQLQNASPDRPGHRSPRTLWPNADSTAVHGSDPVLAPLNAADGETGNRGPASPAWRGQQLRSAAAPDRRRRSAARSRPCLTIHRAADASPP